MKHTTTFIVFFVFTFLGNRIFAETPIFSAKKVQSKAHLDASLEKELKDYEVIELDATKIYEYVSVQPGYANFILKVEDGPQWNISIVLNDLRSEDYRELYSKDGQYRKSEQRATTYKGLINGDEDHRVRISSFEHFFTAMFNKNGDRTYIQPGSSFSKNTSQEHFVVYKDRDVINKGQLSCGGALSGIEEEIKNLFENQKMSAFNGGCLEIAIEADYQYCDAHGSLIGYYIDNILNEAESLYESTFGLEFRKTEQGLWHPDFVSGVNAYNDPYSSFNVMVILQEISGWFGFLDAEATPVVRDIGIVLTGKNVFAYDEFGTEQYSNIGAAWGAYTCVDINQSYAVSEDLTTLHARWYNLAHEIAHNLGALHTSSGIMVAGYDQYANTFSSTSQNEMNAHLDSNGGCLNCGCGSRIANPLTKATKQEIAIFANQELHHNVRDFKRQFISHQREINRVFENKSNDKFTAIQEQLAQLKKQLLKKITYSFVMGKDAFIEKEEVELIDNLLEEYASLTKYESLKNYLTKARHFLPVMTGKELRQALIAFDRASLTDDIPVQPIAQKTSFETSDFPLFQLVQNIQGESHLDYYLPQNGQLTLQLFDVNGRLVKLIKQITTDSGQHQQIIDTNNLGSGIYILRALFSNETTNVNYSSKVITKK